MAGRHKFSELIDKMPPERRALADEMFEAMREEIDLTQPRAAHQLSQAALGEIPHVEQPAAAKIQKLTRM